MTPEDGDAESVAPRVWPAAGSQQLDTPGQALAAAEAPIPAADCEKQVPGSHRPALPLGNPLRGLGLRGQQSEETLEGRPGPWAPGGVPSAVSDSRERGTVQAWPPGLGAQ